MKSTISLFILLWEATDRRDILEYATQSGNDIVLSDNIMAQLLEYTRDVRENNSIDDAAFKSKVNTNQLLKSQLEALIVAFELIWRLGKVTFCTKMAASAERTGNMRFPKKISYSANMDIIHYAVGIDSSNLVKTLLAWLDFPVPTEPTVENALTHILCVFAEDAVFRMETAGNTDIIFNQLGIYQTGLESGDDVNIAGEKEAKGPLRILKNYLKESLNPFLTSPSVGVVSIVPEQEDALQPYAQRVSTLAALNAKDTVTPERENSSVDDDDIEIVDLHKSPNEPRNLIYFGAPGTGKSHQLKKDSVVFGKNIERVTFYPNYSYAQFVGTYKPVMKPKSDDSGEEEITYAYVPGPFIRQWIKAKATNEPVLLIVEELNRANAAAVFGDMFQLLDRKNGESEYPVATSEDLRKYLKSIIAPASVSEEEIKQNEYLPNDTNVDEISIPNNMYIWTTMNSADQGVFPLDTAFKRRWDYKYFSVWEHKDIDDNTVVINNKKYTWGDIREAINDKLADKNVNEDKFIGPYFLSTSVFDDSDDYKAFKNAFKDKVLMYLFEDAARQYKKDIFKTDGKAAVYSKIVESFESKGFDIFQFEINEAKKTEKEVISEED